MIYNHKVLSNEEIAILRDLLETYKDYDKLDILIEMLKNGNNGRNDIKN